MKLPKKMYIWEASNNPNTLYPNPQIHRFATYEDDMQAAVDTLDEIFAEDWAFDNLKRIGPCNLVEVKL